MSHRCCCTMREPYSGRIDWCGFTVESNDQPFCTRCEDAGHPQHPFQHPQLDRELRA